MRVLYAGRYTTMYTDNCHPDSYFRDTFQPTPENRRIPVAITTSLNFPHRISNPPPVD